MKRTKFFLLLPFIGIVFSSCITTHEVLLGDVISFGDDAKTSYNDHNKVSRLFFWRSPSEGKPYKLYDGKKSQDVDMNSYFQMVGRINKTQMENNTAGIYAMDLGLDRIKYIRKHVLKHDPDSRYYIIYMTDGLDNISCEVAKKNRQGNYKTAEKYIAKMKKKITKVSGCKKKAPNPFDIYPIVFTGSDLGAVKSQMTESDFKRFIDNKMGWLRGSSRGVESSPQIIEGENFDVIKEKFYDEFYASGFSFHIPKGYAGKDICMKYKDDNENETELLASFVKKGNGYYLRNIRPKNGLTIEVSKRNGKKTVLTADVSPKVREKLELKAINNRNKKANLAIFQIERPKYKGNTYFIVNDPEHVGQYVSEGGVLVKNSEYASQSKGNVNTYFILIFDASKSLGEEFASEKNTAIDMIKTISQGVMNSQNKLIESNK